MYVRANKAREKLGVADITLRRWADSGKIKYTRVGKGNRLYNIQEFIERQEKERNGVREYDPDKKNFLYCRVSCNKQKQDLERQIAYLQEKYPDHEVVKDIASGINFKRKGFNKMLVEVMSGNVNEVVVTHRDRLCRIAWEHFAWLFNHHGTNLVVEDEQEFSPEGELKNDLLSIIHIFSSGHNGLRRKGNRRSPRKTEDKNPADQREQTSFEDGEEESGESEGDNHQGSRKRVHH